MKLASPKSNLGWLAKYSCPGRRWAIVDAEGDVAGQGGEGAGDQRIDAEGTEHEARQQALMPASDGGTAVAGDAVAAAAVDRLVHEGKAGAACPGRR